MRGAWLMASIAFLWAAPALAEGPEGGQPPPGAYPQQPQQPTPQQPYPQQQPVYYQQQPQQAQPPPPEPEQEARGIEYGAHVLVPIFLSPIVQEDRAAMLGALRVNPGIGIQGRVGWEFPGGFTTELNVGYQGNSFTDFDATLSNFWIGGGARFSFWNPSAFVPFVAAGLKLNFWSACIAAVGPLGEDEIACTGTESTIGVLGTAGAAYELSRWTAVEFGANFDYTLPGDAFDAGKVYVSPFVGGTLYF